MNTTTVCRRRPFQVQRNLSIESLPIRRYHPATPATVLEELPARLVVHFGRHCIRDTNHTAADQPFAASKQDNRDAEATISNSSLKHDHQLRGDDESTFEHVHVPLGKYPSRFLEQMKQQKKREMRIKYDQLQTKTCGTEEDGDHEQNRSPTFESLQMDILSFLLMFVSTRVRDFPDTVDPCTL